MAIAFTEMIVKYERILYIVDGYEDGCELMRQIQSHTCELNKQLLVQCS